MQFAWGYAPTLIIEAAVHHGVFDQLNRQPQTLEQLVAKLGVANRGLKAILDALVGLQLLAREGATYRLTPESATYLVAGSSDYRGAFFRHHTEQLLPQWMQLKEVVRTGQPVKRTDQDTHGEQYFSEFVESLFPGSLPAATMLGKHLGIPAAQTPVRVLDLGAGSGVWGIALAKQSPQVRITAVDWPGVLEVAKKMAMRHGVAERMTVVAGDLFVVDFGYNHQVVTLGHILHSEGPDRGRQLLKKAAEALAPGGTLAIQEFLPNDERTGPPLPLMFAVNMLLNTEAGGTYTFAEITGWLLAAGLEQPRQLPVPGPSPLILANKPVK